MALTDEDLVQLAGRIKDMLLSATPCWGDPQRVAIGHHVALSNTLVNTVIGACTIGDDAAVAAGSLVLGGTPEAGCVYAGVPARWVKKIDFLPDEEQELEVPVVVMP